ncbi:MAG: protein kinase [Planctomycetota bacterium]
MAIDADAKFARFALHQGYISRSRLAACREAQCRLAAEGTAKSLPDLAVELGFLTRRDVETLVDLESNAVLQCPACLRKYIVRRESGDHRCEACGEALLAPASISLRRLEKKSDACDDTRDDLVGLTIGDVKLLQRIGHGGMALVYLAAHNLLNRKVAVKILPRLLALKDARARDRFLREARIALSLSHPNIVEILDIGPFQSSYYIVMERLVGETLAQRLARDKTLPLADATRIVCDVAAALTAAHDKGVIHRDVKPSNIFLIEEGALKLTDFGLAYAAEDTSLTLSGALLGTPAYMSPEQARGEPALPESDLYSLGVVYHELLLGRPPFEGAPAAVLQLHAADDEIPDPRAILPALDPRACAVLRKMLAKRLADRYRTAADLARDLKTLLAGRTPLRAETDDSLRPLRHPLPRARSRARRLNALATALLVGLAAVLALLAALAWLAVSLHAR